MIYTKAELQEKIDSLDFDNYYDCIDLMIVCEENGFSRLADQIADKLYNGDNPLENFKEG